ncbi:MAG: TrbI/VirB10 family protein [Candidatus Acidiferrum sp.]
MTEKNDHSSDAGGSAQRRGTVENKAAKPAGLLPKSTQQFVILGVAMVMILIMWLTGGGKRQGKASASSPASALVEPSDRATVQDFKQTIQKEQAESRQPISAADLNRLESLGLAGDVPPGSVIAPADSTVPQPGGVLGGMGSQPPPSDPLREDRKKREYLSLFADNLAFSARKGELAEHFAGKQSNASNSGGATEKQPDPVTVPIDVDAELRKAEAQFPANNRTVSRSQEQPKSPPESQSKDATGTANPSVEKRHVVFEGTVLETLLINRLNGTFSGPVECLLTNDVYSQNRQRLLIPAGTKVLGEAKNVDALGQQRLAVFFHRLIMPDGFSVPLDEFKGLNQIGETALRDKVNNHYLKIFGASLAIGILGGVAESGSGNVLTDSAVDRIRAGFGGNLANSSSEILDRFLNILPTVTIREGARVKIYLSGDLLLPDYAQHALQPD